MLTTLRIQNLALVEELVWELSPGMVSVTGETGAGKSVIVGALNLVLGERADRSLVRSGEDKCVVEAVFQLADTKKIDAILEESGGVACEDGQLLLRRVVSLNGSNKQFVNCSPVTLNVMKAIGEYLIDLHGPHDHQSLLSRDHQRRLLDAFGAGAQLHATYRREWKAWQDAHGRWKELRESERASEQEIDLLEHQIKEIEAAGLDDLDEEQMLERYRRGTNAVRLIELAGLIGDAVDGDDGVVARLGDVQRAARELERLDPSAAELFSGLDSAVIELGELSSGLADYRDDVEIDPREIARLEQRVDVIESLKRKYGDTLDEVKAFYERASERLHSIQNRGDELERLEAEATAAEARVREVGATLSAVRTAAAPKLAAEIEANLKDLGFKQSRFAVDVEPLDAPGPHGLDAVEFQFMPNPGEPAKPLRLIGSSGEISRVMLAVKSALAEQDEVALLVFDEIDANVGGEVAHAVGRKMQAIATKRQLITITHLPQVAACGGQHFVVDKVVEDERTHSKLREVTGDERVGEIARMLGGSTSESGRQHAKALLVG